MTVHLKQATVYFGGNRRWFTLMGACRAEARLKIKARCDCETIDHGNMGMEHLTCSYHHQDRYGKIVRRLAQKIKIAYINEQQKVKP